MTARTAPHRARRTVSLALAAALVLLGAVTVVPAVAAGDAILAGTARDAEGRTLGGVTVEAQRWDGDWVWESDTWTEEDGSFELTGLTPGTYILWFADNDAGWGFYDQYLGGRTVAPATPDAAGTFALVAGPNPAVDAVLALGASLTGVVTTPAGHALDDGTVEAFRWDAGTGAWRGTAQTLLSGTGGFHFGVVPPGDYTLRFEGTQGVRDYEQYLDGGAVAPVDPTAPGVLHLDAGDSGPGAVVLVSGPVVLGTVVPPPGLAAESLVVELFEVTLSGADGIAFIRGGEHAGFVDVAADGTFRLGGLAPDRVYSASIAGPGVVGQFLGGAELLDEASWFTVDDAAVAFDLSGTGGADVRVTDDDGAPVAGAELELFRWDGAWVSAIVVTTDETGTAAVRALPPGTYTASVRARRAYPQYPGGGTAAPAPTDPAATFVVPADGIVRRDVELEPFRTLAGSITGTQDPTALLVRLIEGQFVDGMLDVWRDASVGYGPEPDGGFALAGMIPGRRYAVLVSGPDLEPGFVSATGLVAEPANATWWWGDADVDAGTVDLAPPTEQEPEPEPVDVASTVTLSSSRAAQVYGSTLSATLTATVAVPGASTSGVVVFRDGAKELGAVPVALGRASLRVKRTLAVGSHRLTAEFVPSHEGVTGSTSSSVRLTVRKARPKVTAKLVTKSVGTHSKAKVRVRITVTGVARPTGKVVVYEGRVKLKTVTVKAKHKGMITVKLPRLTPGKHRLKVTYRGSSNVARKTSKAFTLRVR